MERYRITQHCPGVTYPLTYRKTLAGAKKFATTELLSNFLPPNHVVIEVTHGPKQRPWGHPWPIRWMKMVRMHKGTDGNVALKHYKPTDL